MLRVIFVVTLLFNLIACSSTPGWKGVYSDEKKESTTLDVPPDLSHPNVSDSLALPNIALNDSTYSKYSHTENTGAGVLPANNPDVKVIRDGMNIWLEIKEPAEKIWMDLNNFFTDVGFKIEREDKNLGIMETNWLENRASLQKNWLTKLLNKILATGMMDKYRARLEKTDQPGVTLVFITHQGLTEHASDDALSVIKWWERIPADPELEAEMIQRFLVYRDISLDKAKSLVAQAKTETRASIIVKEDAKVLQVKEGFARTWRRVGIALDRIGLLVEDRNRSSGLYYLRITDDFRQKVKDDTKGWFSSLFSDSNVKLKERYTLNVSEENNISYISIYESSGAKADIRFVDKLLGELKTYLD